MRYILLAAAFSAVCCHAAAQTTITAADMPVAGDTLRYSTASIVGATFNLNDTGANKAWDYTSLVATAQQVDTYKTATQVNILYGATAPAGCFGYKVADSIPGLGGVLPISISEIYTFFNELTSPAAYAATAFGATVSGFPLASKYSIKDEWYFFPLSYGRRDSSNFAFAESLPGIGSLNEGGSRVTKADGWGTVKTPFYTTPVNCLRVRSEVNGVDTIVVTALGLNVPLPVNTVDYKWLVNGQHYPAVWITTNKATGTETITSITYRDSARVFEGVNNVQVKPQMLSSFPNPAAAGRTTIAVPDSWGNYSISLFDVQGRELLVTTNKNVLDVSALPAGNYIARVSALNRKGHCVISK